jgi:ribosome-associated translation inhibitor RaiA
MIELGGNITLVGFREIDYAEMIVVKKMIGNYVRKFSDKAPINNFTLTMKEIHKTSEESGKFELKAKIDLNGEIINSEVVDYNLFIGMDAIMKKLEAQILK